MIELCWLQPQVADEPLLLDLLDEAERARAARFRHGADRLAYAAAHALLRTLLSEIGGGPPQDWRFVRSPTGKPRLAVAGGRPDLRFSLSHARGMVACAVAACVEVGVDVEPLTPVPDAVALARSHFSPREADGLQAMAEPGRSEAFLHLWTLKEAASKASGAGLQHRIEHPEFEPTLVAGSGERRQPLHASDWTFRSFILPGPFRLSLAFPEEGQLEPMCCEAALMSRAEPQRVRT